MHVCVCMCVCVCACSVLIWVCTCVRNSWPVSTPVLTEAECSTLDSSSLEASYPGQP